MTVSDLKTPNNQPLAAKADFKHSAVTKVESYLFENFDESVGDA